MDSHSDGDTSAIPRADSAGRGGDQLFGLGCSTGCLEGAERPFARQAPSPGRIVGDVCRDFLHLNQVEADDLIDIAEQTLSFGEVENANQDHGKRLAVRAITLALEDDTHNASWAAEQALRLGAAGEHAKLARLVVRFCAWKAGTAPASHGDSTICALEAAGTFRSGSATGALADALDLTLAAAIEFSRLRVVTAERLARCALKRADRVTAANSSPASVLAWILYEQGKLEEAEQILRPRLPVIGTTGGVDCVAHRYRVLARIAALNGDRANAMAILGEGCELAETRNWPRLLAAMLAERIRLCQPGDEARVDTWLTQLRNLAERHHSLARCARSDIACHLSRAQLYTFLTFRSGPTVRTGSTFRTGSTIRTGDSPRAALAHLRHDAWLTQDLHALALVNLTEAQVLWIEGDQGSSVGCLAEALRTAEVTGLRQSLVDAGPLLPAMMERFLHGSRIEPELLAFTICMMDTLECRPAPVREKGRRAIRGGDGLTIRERDVLKLIGEGRTNKMIAQVQGIAPETVKTHVKNIFAKLGVERRAQAVAKAQRLGLLCI